MDHPRAKPPLTFLYEGALPGPIEAWPEVGVVEIVDAHEAFMQNFCMGGPFDAHGAVVSIPYGSQDGLKYLGCLKNILVVAVRPEDSVGGADHGDWYEELAALGVDQGWVVCGWGRHEVAVALAKAAFWDGLDRLTYSLQLLRGPGVEPSDAAMRTESTLTRSVEALAKTGFHAPRRQQKDGEG